MSFSKKSLILEGRGGSNAHASVNQSFYRYIMDVPSR
ncbi:hypothetical protein J2S17_001750 [Cytobacillus purgationiresistens]|uniref:Uncharacterized protein n=1 Tax=Cytobacillus purgationiresistens TaxID=863449 RepID=A0ABU0AF44_9BACI|nr:hypothetical protein [Cytobacillus purgationiresistens]